MMEHKPENNAFSLCHVEQVAVTGEVQVLKTGREWMKLWERDMGPCWTFEHSSSLGGTCNACDTECVAFFSNPQVRH